MNDLKQLSELFVAKFEQKIPEVHPHRWDLPSKEVLLFKLKSANRIRAGNYADSGSAPDTACISSRLPHKTRADEVPSLPFSNGMTTEGRYHSINILNFYQGGLE